MKLEDIASVIRSKNAGPRALTLDVMFADDAGYARAAQSPALTAPRIAAHRRAVRRRRGRRAGHPVSARPRHQDRHAAPGHCRRPWRHRRLWRAAARAASRSRAVTASLRVIDAFRRSGRNALRVLGASGQLGYGVPTPAFHAGLAREPDIIGCDMGSIDIGPYYLGAGRMATATAATRR